MGGVTVAVTADEIPHSEFFRNPGSLAELDSALEAYTYLEVMYFFFFTLNRRLWSLRQFAFKQPVRPIKPFAVPTFPISRLCIRNQRANSSNISWYEL